MADHPQLVHYLLGENGDHKFPQMATINMLQTTDDVVMAAAIPRLLDSLSRFIPEDDIEPRHLERIQHATQMLHRLCALGGPEIEEGEFSLARAAAILWSAEFQYLEPLAQSSEVLDRTLLALADVPSIDGKIFWNDNSDFVRAAVVFGHGAMCPLWSGSEVDTDPSALVREALNQVIADYRYEEPDSEYQCGCSERNDSETSVSDSTPSDWQPEDHHGEERFDALAAMIREILNDENDIAHESDLLVRLRLLTAITRAAHETRERCYEEGARLGAYNDRMVNHDLGALIYVLLPRQRQRWTPEELHQGVKLADEVLWLIADSLRRYPWGDWLKRLDGAVQTLCSQHPELREYIHDQVAEIDAPWPDLFGDSDIDKSFDDSLPISVPDSDLAPSSPDEPVLTEGAGILNFHQAMWLVEGEGPLTLRVEPGEGLSPAARNWADQADFEEYLPAAWHARRTDDWSFFVPLVARIASDDPANRFSAPNRALYNALNHMLLYAGDGQHPVAAIGELLSQQEEFPHLGGFTKAFKECWLPLLPDMWHWWQSSSYAPHNRGGTLREWIDADLGPLNVVPGRTVTDDPMHLSGHCGSPLGQDWTDSDRPLSDGTTVLRHEPTVVTVTSSNYRGWMAAMRLMETAGPTIVRVQVSNDALAEDVTLGFWLVQKFEHEHPLFRNHARFLTDGAAPAVLSVVREWKWSFLDEVSDDDDDSEDDLAASSDLGLFDGANISDLRQMLIDKETVRSVILQILGVVKDNFVLSIDVDDDTLVYVQGIVEDEQHLHVELSHEKLLSRELPPDRKSFLAQYEWNAPEKDLPNYWRLLKRDEWSDSAIAEYLVAAMDYVFSAFTDLPDGAIIEVRPLEVAMQLDLNDFEVVQVDLPDGQGSIEIPDAPPKD